ncbi:MAG: hypothetical protein ACOCZA_08855 [Spirochaetota bacterium]
MLIQRPGHPADALGEVVEAEGLFAEGLAAGEAFEASYRGTTFRALARQYARDNQDWDKMGVRA